VANLAYAAELAKTSPQVELGFGDDEQAEEEEILFERESPDRQTADRPSFASPRGRTPPLRPNGREPGSKKSGLTKPTARWRTWRQR
jgi:hypothetical protein